MILKKENKIHTKSVFFLLKKKSLLTKKVGELLAVLLCNTHYPKIYLQQKAAYAVKHFTYVCNVCKQLKVYIYLRGEQSSTYSCCLYSGEFETNKMKVCIFMLVCFATVCFSTSLENVQPDQIDLEDNEGY